MSARRRILAAGEQRFELEVQKTSDDGQVAVTIGERHFDLHVDSLDAACSAVTCDGGRLIVRHARDGGALLLQIEGRALRFDPVRGAGRRGASGGGDISAPMPGAISRIMVAVGDRVVAKAPLYGLEAMKMESVVEAPYAAKVVAIKVAVGEQVEGGAEVIVLEKA